MLEESNETIFQMKDAMYFSFKELQFNMDYIFCIAIRSNITLHDPFLRIIIWITRLYIASILYMNDDSIWNLHLFDCESTKRINESAYHA